MILPYPKSLIKWSELKSQAGTVAAKLAATTAPANKAASKESSAAYWEGRANRMADCASRIEYTYCPECGSMHVARTNLCRDRLCPVCSWRLALRRCGDMMRALEWLYERDGFINGAMLTLTIKNVPVGELSRSMDELLAAWSRMRKRRAFQRWVIGYARSLEITKGKGTFHPHLHVFLLFDKGYDKSISQAEFCTLWRESLGVDYTPICDVRRAYKKRVEMTENAEAWKEAMNAVLECTKYALSGKVTTAAGPDELGAIALALRDRRLISYGGALSQARAALKLSDDDSAVDVSDTIIECPKCGNTSTITLAFEWATAGGYLLSPIHYK